MVKFVTFIDDNQAQEVASGANLLLVCNNGQRKMLFLRPSPRHYWRDYLPTVLVPGNNPLALKILR